MLPWARTAASFQLLSTPAATKAAAALNTTASLWGPGRPARTPRKTPAFSRASPPRSASRGDLESPTSSGDTLSSVILPWRSTATTLGPERESSSTPPWPCTTTAPWTPRAERASAMGRTKGAPKTPTSWCVAPAGFARGPRTLKMVRTPRDRRTPATCLMVPWKCGAKRNAMPEVARLLRTSSGDPGKVTPSSSSTSALPHRLETDRLPCLATGIPAPATTKDAAVEMLNVPDPSPPVPQRSSRGERSVSTRRARWRKARAAATISSTDSPLHLNPMSNPATWASGAPPSRTTPMAASISSPSRSFPAVTFSKKAFSMLVSSFLFSTYRILKYRRSS